MMADTLALVDAGVADWFHGHAVPGLTLVMLVITQIHSLLGINIVAAVLACFLICRRDCYWLLALVLALPGGMLLNTRGRYRG